MTIPVARRSTMSRLVGRTAAILLLFLVLVGPSMEGGEPDANVVRLTQDGYFKQRPAWSPDDRYLAFARHRGASIAVYLRDVQTDSERRLSARTQPHYDAVFSPDGNELLLAYDDASPNQGDLEVYRSDLSGETLERVAGTEGKLSHEESPCYAPSGDRIAYTSTRYGNQELCVARRDGTQEVRLTNDPAIDAHPAWSPDGKRIAFATNRWGDLELAVVDVQGKHLTRLTESPGLDDYPAWSPDGRQLAWTSNRDGNLEIYVAGADGQHARNVTKHGGWDNFPTWHPEGRLTFVSNRSGGFDVYMMK